MAREADRYVVAVSMAGAIGGGLWLGLAAAVLVSGFGGLFDVAAGLVCAVLLALIARLVTHYGGLRALCTFLTLTVLAAASGGAAFLSGFAPI